MAATDLDGFGEPLVAASSTAEPVTAEMVELGPVTTCREVVNNGKTSRARAAAYSPYCTGTALISA